MRPSDSPSRDDARRQLERADTQLALYARDLKKVVDSERAKARELAEANRRLAILNRLKTDFLAFISHELRTPLCAMSLLDDLDPAGLAPDQREAVEIIRRGHERLELLVQKGLDYFAWLAVETVEAPEMVDLIELVRSVAASIPELAGGRFDFRLAAPNRPLRVRGRRDALAEVIEILLENAVKFSGDARSIAAELEEDGAAGLARCAVSDRGVGISPEMAREIFRPFTVGDVAHHTSGSGLNLAIARAIVEAHRGRLEAASRGKREGATFHLLLPLAGAGERR